MCSVCVSGVSCFGGIGRLWTHRTHVVHHRKSYRLANSDPLRLRQSSAPSPLQRAILLRACLVLSLAGMITAGATLTTIVRQYCAEEEDGCVGDGLTTLSYMSRKDPQRSLLANGMTSSVVLLCSLVTKRCTSLSTRGSVKLCGASTQHSPWWPSSSPSWALSPCVPIRRPGFI